MSADLRGDGMSDTRFWSKVNRTETCWLWAGASNPQGYGHLRVGKKHVRAHRYAYELLVGPIPEGLQLDHLCCVTSCVNPAHLEPVTAQENMRRRQERSEACRRGHRWDEPGVAWIKPSSGRRACRKCMTLSQRKRRARRRLEAA